MNELLDVNHLRSLGVAPKFFGLGFIQMKLSENRRIHFFHPDLRGNVGDEELHDHRYDFVSSILVGSITNELCEFTPIKGGGQIMSKVSCQAGVTVPESEVPVEGKVEPLANFTTSAGSRYFLPNTMFHRVHATRCVTHLERGPILKPFASVIRSRSAAAVCPFDVSMTEGQCWEIIADLVGQEAKPGYHLRKITKGVLGDASKIIEELDEFKEATEQGVTLMALLELADMQGAVEAYLAKHHPSINMNDLREMSNVTRRAFENGRR